MLVSVVNHWCDDEKEWAQNTTMCNPAGDATISRMCITVGYKLRPVCKIISEPLQGNTTKENRMIYCVKCLGENTASVLRSSSRDDMT